MTSFFQLVQTPEIDPETLQILKKKLEPDYRLYNHFSAKFNAHVQAYGANRMAEEVKKFHQASEEVLEKCNFKLIHGEDIMDIPSGRRAKVNNLLKLLTIMSVAQLIELQLEQMIDSKILSYFSSRRSTPSSPRQMTRTAWLWQDLRRATCPSSGRESETNIPNLKDCSIRLGNPTLLYRLSLANHWRNSVLCRYLRYSYIRFRSSKIGSYCLWWAPIFNRLIVVAFIGNYFNDPFLFPNKSSL